MVGFEQAIGNAFIIASPDVSQQIGTYKQTKMEEAGRRVVLAQLKVDAAREQGLDGILDLLLAQSELEDAQADFNSWTNGGLNATLLHTASGALQGLATGNFLGGALSAGLSEAGSSYFDNGPDWLQRVSAIGFGVLGSSYAGSNVFALQGAGIAYTADTYNRYLHDRERKAIMARVEALTKDPEKRIALYLRIVGEALKTLDNQFKATYEQKEDDYAAGIFKTMLVDPANKGLFDPTVKEQSRDWLEGSTHKQEKEALTDFWDWINPARLGAQDAFLLPPKVNVPVAVAKAVVNLPSDAVNLTLTAAEGYYNLLHNGLAGDYELFARVPDLTDSLFGIETTPMEKLVGGLLLVPAGELLVAGREASLARAADEAANAKYLQTLGADNDIWSFRLSGLESPDAAPVAVVGSGAPVGTRVAFWSAEGAGEGAGGASPGFLGGDGGAAIPDYPSYPELDFGDFSEGWGVLEGLDPSHFPSFNSLRSSGIGDASVAEMRPVPSIVDFQSQVGGVYSPISLERQVQGSDYARPVTLDEFIRHVEASGINEAFLLPLEDVYTSVYLAEKYARPLPSTYLTERFMAEHVEQFLAGAARVDLTASFNARYLRNIEDGLPFGRKDAVFLSPARLIDDLYATGDASVMESALGFESGAFSGAGGMTRTYVYDPLRFNLRFSIGSESGANPYWLPGGYTYKTSGGAGVPEMVTDVLPSPLINPNIKVMQ